MLEIRALGQFELRLNGAAVLLPSRPTQSLLVYLTVTAGAAHRREKLAGMLWPDAEEDNARNSLRHALWRIRKAIEPDELVSPYLVTDDLAVTFNARADYWFDVALLTRDGDTVQDLMDSVSVYRGELLPGFYDDWVSLEREHVDSVFQHKMQQLLDALIAERRWSDVLKWGERWVALGRTPEPGYRALMRAHAELGDRSRMAAVYQRCREALFNELGVEPSPQTRRLYERLRQDDSELGPLSHSVKIDEPPAPGAAPFQGLRYFDEADTDRFFGRERLTEQLLSRTRQENFVAVIGASGSGKSSVVRGGLVPALRHSSRVLVLTPTARPLEALATALEPRPARALEELMRDAHGLKRLLRAGNGRDVVLVVDQFEELFTLCNDPFEREAFVENLLAATAEGSNIRVIIALRADFYAQCADFASLRRAIADHQEYVGLLDPLELRRAIEAPAAQGGWELEQGLVELLLRDAGEEPGALPLLSHALLETWHRRKGRLLTLAGYTASGGVHGAIAHTAETVYSQRLTSDQQSIARRVFLRLTELGEGTQDTRRRAALEELIRRPEEERDVRTVLRALAEARLISLGNTTAEVAHEALIREWSRLREWLNQDRAELRIHRQLSAAAGEWRRLGEDTGSLYRGARLTQALEWAAAHSEDLAPLENTFLQASRKAAESEVAEREAQRERELAAAQQLAQAEQRRADAERQRADEQRHAAGRLRQRALLLAVAFGLALSMAGLALFFGDTARQQAVAAEADARAAVSRELAAAALTNLSVDPERAALLALRAIDTTHSIDGTWTAEAEDALHRAAPLLRAQLTLTGHTGKVLAVAFSPNGGHVATGGQDGVAIVWNAATGHPEFTLHGHAGPVNAVLFSPDAQWLATASDDQSARLWDALTGKPKLTLSGFTREVERLAVTPDATRLATSSLDGTVAVWRTDTGQALFSFHPDRAGQSALPVDIAFNPDGTRLATATPSGDVYEWDVSTGSPQLVRSWVSSATGVMVRSVAFSPDGARIASTSDTGADLWWTGTGEPSLTIMGHAVQVLRETFSPDGAAIATGSVDQTARVWDARSGRQLLSLAGHQAPVAGVAFSPDSRRLATASWDGTTKIWDLGPARELLTIPSSGALISFAQRVGDAPQVSPVAVSQDGTRWFAGLWDGTAILWDSSSGQERLSLALGTSQVWGVAISPDGSRLATGSDDRTVRVFDSATGKTAWSGIAHSGPVAAVAFSPDGTRVASASADNSAIVWDVASGTPQLTLSGQSDPLSTIAFSPDGAEVITTSVGLSDNIRVWDSHSGTLLRTLAGHTDAVWSAAFSSDGTRVVTASRDGTARVWDPQTGDTVLSVHAHTGTLVSAAISRDGQRLATGSRDGTVQVWDATNGQEILKLQAADTGLGVDSVAFSPDGRQLVVRTDRAVSTYALSIDDLVRVVQARLTRWWTVDECQQYLHSDQCPERPSQSVAPANSIPQVPAAPEQQPPLAPRLTPPVVLPVPALAPTTPLVGTVKIVSVLSRTGLTRTITDQIINAYRMALEEHNQQVGNAALSLEDLSDTSAAQGTLDANSETRIDNAAVNDPDVLVYLGPSLSSAARVAIPILCKAQMAIISPTATYPGLTKQTPFNLAGEPDVYYPGCQRNFARVVPTDDQQGAVGAAFAKQLGVHNVYVLHDGSIYGQAIAAVFATSAKQIGLQVVGGPESMDPSAADYHDLAERVHEANPDLVYFGGIDANHAGKLWQDLRAALDPDVSLMGADGINENAFIDAAGGAAEGTYATFPGVPAPKLTGKGANWYQRYMQKFGETPQPYVAYAYEAMNVALDAIARAGVKDRAAVRDAILATRSYDGVLGLWSLTSTGDTTLSTMMVRQVRNGAWDPTTVQIISGP